jgi:hypothetical protein
MKKQCVKKLTLGKITIAELSKPGGLSLVVKGSANCVFTWRPPCYTDVN